MNTSLGLVIDANPGWTEEVTNLVPGAHVAVLADDATVGIEGRLAGLHLRDTILVLRPGPTTGFVFIFRRPIVDGTVAAQVTTTGTGALNIDACRVASDSLPNPSVGPGFGSQTKANLLHGIRGKDYYAGTSFAYEPNTLGRWPPNVVLVHGAGCRNIGTKEVRGSHDTTGVWGQAGSARVYEGGWAGDPQEKRRGYTSDGTETVAAWECEPGCPVPILDGQSGELKTNPGTVTTAMASMGFHGGSGSSREVRADKGGASRFFPQFADEAEMRAWIERLVVASMVPPA